MFYRTSFSHSTIIKITLSLASLSFFTNTALPIDSLVNMIACMFSVARSYLDDIRIKRGDTVILRIWLLEVQIALQ